MEYKYNSLYVDIFSEYFKCNCFSNERTERATFFCAFRKIYLLFYIRIISYAINQNFIGECCELKDDESIWWDVTRVCWSAIRNRD